MYNVRQLLDEKGTDIWSVAPQSPVFEAIKLMAEKQIGALLVMDNGSMCGIVSERDYARKVILQGRASRETPVADIMTPNVITVGLLDTSEHCMGIMTQHRIRHLPVVVDGNVTGMLSIGDLVRSVIADQALQIEQLERYIAG